MGSPRAVGAGLRGSCGRGCGRGCARAWAALGNWAAPRLCRWCHRQTGRRTAAPQQLQQGRERWDAGKCSWTGRTCAQLWEWPEVVAPVSSNAVAGGTAAGGATEAPPQAHPWPPCCASAPRQLPPPPADQTAGRGHGAGQAGEDQAAGAVAAGLGPTSVCQVKLVSSGHMLPCQPPLQPGTPRGQQQQQRRACTQPRLDALAAASCFCWSPARTTPLLAGAGGMRRRVNCAEDQGWGHGCARWTAAPGCMRHGCGEGVHVPGSLPLSAAAEKPHPGPCQRAEASHGGAAKERGEVQPLGACHAHRHHAALQQAAQAGVDALQGATGRGRGGAARPAG